MENYIINIRHNSCWRYYYLWLLCGFWYQFVPQLNSLCCVNWDEPEQAHAAKLTIWALCLQKIYGKKMPWLMAQQQRIVKNYLSRSLVLMKDHQSSLLVLHIVLYVCSLREGLPGQFTDTCNTWQNIDWEKGVLEKNRLMASETPWLIKMYMWPVLSYSLNFIYCTPYWSWYCSCYTI